MSQNVKRSARDYCELFHRLDKKYGTITRSPLHHDNRCPIHKNDKGGNNA